MTSWLCSFRAAAALAALTAGAFVVPYGSCAWYGAGGTGTYAAYAAGPSPSASAEAPEMPAEPSPSGASSSARPAADPVGLPLVLPAAAPSASSASRSAPPSRAGSVPGEGRERPGRHVEDREERREAAGQDGTWPGGPVHPHDGRDTGAVREDGGQDARPAPSGTVPETGAAVPRGDTRAERPVGPPLRILPLGGGLILIGLGLGFAFLGLRLRRV